MNHPLPRPPRRQAKAADHMGRRAVLRAAGALALFCLAGGTLLPAPAAAITLTARDQADIARVKQYLDGIRSMTAVFTQIAPDGSLSTGKIFLRRPGRVRFEYDPPSPTLVVADGIWIVFHDKELKQTTRLPLGDNPLSILLADKVELTDAATVKAISRDPGALRITVFDPAKPKQGTLTLVFSDAPLALRQWEVTDAQGQRTTVALDHIQTGVDLPQRLFVFNDNNPRENRLGQ